MFNFIPYYVCFFCVANLGNTGNPVTGSGYQPGSDAQQRSRGSAD